MQWNWNLEKSEHWILESRVLEISVPPRSSSEIVIIVKLKTRDDVVEGGDRIFTTDVTAK